MVPDDCTHRCATYGGSTGHSPEGEMNSNQCPTGGRYLYLPVWYSRKFQVQNYVDEPVMSQCCWSQFI